MWGIEHDGGVIWYQQLPTSPHHLDFIFRILGKEAMNTSVEEFANALPTMCHHFNVYFLELLVRHWKIHYFFFKLLNVMVTLMRSRRTVKYLNWLWYFNLTKYFHMQNMVNWEVILPKNIDNFPSLFLHFAGGWWSPWLYKVTNRTAGAGSVWRKSDWYIASWQGRAHRVKIEEARYL